MYLPAIALALALSATLARLTRSSMLEVLRQDYIRTARAEGPARTRRPHQARTEERDAAGSHLVRHCSSASCSAAPSYWSRCSRCRAWARCCCESVITKDFTQIQGLVLFFAVIIILINIAVDLSYACSTRE